MGQGLKALAAGLVLSLSVCGPASAQDVTAADVSKAIEDGKAVLKNRVINSAPIVARGNNYSQVGVPMLGVLALLNAGVPGNDPSISGLIADVAAMENQATYTVGLKCQILAAANPLKYNKELQAAADWLSKSQLQDTGTWTYNPGRRVGMGDNSNTQYALLGLHEAAKAGATVPKEVWDRARAHFEITQIVNDRNPANNGGWTYMGNAGQAYGSMTVAGIASLYICGARLEVGGAKEFKDGVYPSCGKYKQNEAIKKGLDWLARNFSATENPLRRGQWSHYYLYGMERVGMISGLRAIGTHDWYREGAAALVAKAEAPAVPGRFVPNGPVGQRADGSWGQAYDTAFAVLFLAKGNRPVLVQKLQWDLNSMEWSRNRHDLENLTSFIGDKFGKPVTWQAVTLKLPMSELRISPILYITGHDFPRFDDADIAKLRQFVDTGGTLLFEACCGSPKYTAAMRELAVRLFPDYPLRPLPAGHPVFSSYFKLADTYGLEAIEVGCRVGVFFSPHALSCLWEMQDYKDLAGKKWSEMAFQIGTNIAAYATGKEMLPDRLAKVVLPEAGRAATTQPLEVPRGAGRLARLIHDGDYNCDARALERLCYELRDKAKVAVVPAAKHLAPIDEKLSQYPVLFMTGHGHFKYAPAEIKALRTYLDRGGFLLAEACCGREPFDTSFREMVAQLYPESGAGALPARGAEGGLPFGAPSRDANNRTAAPPGPAAGGRGVATSALTRLPADHALYSGKIGVPLGELRYRKTLADELKSRGTTRPPLEAVIVDAAGAPAGAGVEAATGRTTILYSPYDWSCALEGDNPFSCRGYIDEDGLRLALNLVLYAIGY